MKASLITVDCNLYKSYKSVFAWVDQFMQPGTVLYLDDFNSERALPTQGPKLAWSEFIISNKNYKEKDRSQAIEYLINTICLSAKDAGYLSVWTCVVNEHLITKYENCGFNKMTSNCTEMIKFL